MTFIMYSNARDGMKTMYSSGRMLVMKREVSLNRHRDALHFPLVSYKNIVMYMKSSRYLWELYVACSVDFWGAYKY